MKNLSSFVRIAIAAAVLATPAAAFDTPPAADAASPGRLLAVARAQRDEKGCTAALPAFRVVAAMGEGQEAAQHELAACLLQSPGANAADEALLRQEGRFWMLRAASAGNARAQRALAMDHAAPTSPDHDPKAALQWALIYERNPQASLYGEDRLPPTLVGGLKESLSAADAEDAERAAAAFTPFVMAKFQPPPRPRLKRGDRPEGMPRPERRPR